MVAKAELDKYYTPQSMINLCMDELTQVIGKNCQLIEPSAGDGRFVLEARQRGYNAHGYDIHPDTQGIDQMDFLTSYVEDFHLLGAPTVVYGNPPFGKGCSLAIRFFNHAASTLNPDVIAFIIPSSFGKKLSMRERLDHRYSLYKSIPLQGHFERIDGVVYEGVGALSCEFQIWFKKSRKSLAIPEPELYSIVRPKTHKVKVQREDGSWSNREQPVGDLDVDFTIVTHGAKCGTIQDFNPLKDKSNVKQFIKVKDKKDIDKVKEMIQNADFSYFKESASIVGAQSCLATEEIICCVENKIDYRLKEWFTEIDLYIN